MPSGQFTLYEINLADIRLADLAGATIKAALLGSGYTPDTSGTGDETWSDISAHEIAAGNGYVAGGQALANDQVIAASGGWAYDSDDVVWTASGGNIPAWRRAVLYVAGTLWGKTNPLIGVFLGDSTPADVPATSDGNPLTLTAPAGGWFSLTQP